MLRPRSLRIVVTFETTTAAMQTEQAAHAHGVPGRLIPVPREITAGCGLAWSAPPEAENALRTLIVSSAIPIQDIHHLMI